MLFHSHVILVHLQEATLAEMQTHQQRLTELRKGFLAHDMRCGQMVSFCKCVSMRKNREIEIGLHGSLHIEVGNALTLPERARWRPVVTEQTAGGPANTATELVQIWWIR